MQIGTKTDRHIQLNDSEMLRAVDDVMISRYFLIIISKVVIVVQTQI